ncbi:MAG TPA: PAS domain-containing protein [Polyangia bacterium]|nr:PAS domain-containing protein [Polyangia bacterium]
MSGVPVEGDALSRWLMGEGRESLDGITGEARDVIAIIDRDLTLRYINWTMPASLREEIVGKSVLDLFPVGYKEIGRETYHQVLRTGQRTQFETMYAHGPSLLIWDVRVGPIRCDGEIIGLIAITNDVTEQRRGEADRDRFFSLSLDMFVVVNAKGEFKRINPAFGETLGYRSTELRATPFIDLVHADDRSRTLETFERVLHGTQIFDFENRLVRKDGQDRVFSWRATIDPITHDVYGVARDVTAQRGLEAQLRQAQKMEAVGQLAGGIAHDFNNLMLAILANAEAARSAVGGASETAACLAEIEAAGRRAATLTNQLLAFSRRQPFRPVAIDLNRLIQGLIDMLGRLLPENITMTFTPGADLPAVKADPAHLEQVVVNLCVNARDAMVRGGHLSLETQAAVLDAATCEAHPWVTPGRFAQLTVSDTGVGMTREVRERAFEPFFSTKGAHSGTGLGLATIYGMVQQHGGLVRVNSQLGQGTSVSILLPGEGRAASEIEDAGDRTAPATHQETILLAEDEERVRKVIVLALERAGFRTLVAADGREAIRLLREDAGSVDMVVLDVVMPELGGPATWEQMRRMRGDLRVLFISGYADDHLLAQLPPDAEVLGKPFRMEELVTRIRKKLAAAS